MVQEETTDHETNCVAEGIAGAQGLPYEMSQDNNLNLTNVEHNYSEMNEVDDVRLDEVIGDLWSVVLGS